MTKIRLLDVEKIAKHYPKTFLIIPREELKKIKKGDFVKVMNKNERFWVEISKVRNNGKYEGLIANQLAFTKKHKYGDKIELLNKNILTIDGYKKESYWDKIKSYLGLDATDDSPVAVGAQYARP